ncbi:MAG: hypothetical protein VR72_20995 [Clostridiaceae bacterium BRH_c20a]|nr:MAG: hypothetical protein VR72_20995 [Clostridiaceae bacterium BRH_c20a]
MLNGEQKTRDILSLPGIGKKRQEDLAKLGLKSIEDFLSYIPRRYEDRSQLKPFSQLINGNVETILGTISKVEILRPKKYVSILKVILHNNSQSIAAVWFNQTFLKNKLKPGMQVIVTGKVDFRYEKQIVVSDYEAYDPDGKQLHTARIVPVYSGSEQISSKFLRDVIYNILEKYLLNVTETIPEEIINKYDLLKLEEAIKEIHFPSNWQLLKRARYRLVFEELLLLQLGIKNLKKQLINMVGISHTKEKKLTDSLLNSIPFSLTQAQVRVVSEIGKDMEEEIVMSRLVQGDVGSGKTIIAAWSLVKALAGGYQGALMAPTEILAEQHYLSLKEMLKPLGIDPVLLTGSLTLSEKRKKLYHILQGDIKLVIGTHALIQDEVIFRNLGLVVIDEQHRFGVKQRLALQEKGLNPDVLVMTATPIPRSLALTLYGDMDLSVIDELPPGRQPVKTYHIMENMRQKVYNLINREIKNGQQVYIVCPLIEESEKLDLEDALRLAENLKTNIFPQFEIGILHGRMGLEEKEQVMARLRTGKIAILVTTTVIEVGVNVPNATVIVVENAERFGLAQLHQLRGRVGRGDKQAYCILISDPKTEEGKARMEVMTQSGDGFYIAEQDLKIRGPGEIFGTRQHGLPDLKIADLVEDRLILEEAKNLAEQILNEGLDIPKYQKLKEAMQIKFYKHSSS